MNNCECYIENLPTELLIYIFKFLSVQDLCHLKETCKRFSKFINLWDKVLVEVNCLVTNQISPKFLTRCNRKITSNLEMLRIEQNWIRGRYHELSYFHVKKRYMPWLSLDHSYLWFSRGSKIYIYKRKNDSILLKPHDVINSGIKGDVTKFRVKNGVLASGYSDGSILIKLCDKNPFFKAESGSYVCSVDISHDNVVLASGNRDNFLELWTIKRDPRLILEKCHSELLSCRPWCVSFCNESPYLAVGTATTTGESLLLYDTQRLEEFVGLKGNQITMDIKWENPNSLWSCGNDSLQRWDLRTGECVQSGLDHFGAKLYCLHCDFYNTVIVGTYMHGRVVLWDSRNMKCRQFFFMDSCQGWNHSSPVYSLSFDSNCLFAATDQSLNILNFSGYGGKVKNYFG